MQNATTQPHATRQQPANTQPRAVTRPARNTNNRPVPIPWLQRLQLFFWKRVVEWLPNMQRVLRLGKYFYQCCRGENLYLLLFKLFTVSMMGFGVGVLLHIVVRGA